MKISDKKSRNHRISIRKFYGYFLYFRLPEMLGTFIARCLCLVIKIQEQEKGN